MDSSTVKVGCSSFVITHPLLLCRSPPATGVLPFRLQESPFLQQDPNPTRTLLTPQPHWSGCSHVPSSQVNTPHITDLSVHHIHHHSKWWNMTSWNRTKSWTRHEVLGEKTVELYRWRWELPHTIGTRKAFLTCVWCTGSHSAPSIVQLEPWPV